MNKKLAIEKFEQIRDIPYRIPLGLNEIDDCCSGKHLSLSIELQKLGYKCKYKVCAFKWSDLKLPEELLATPHEDTSTHVYLEVEIDNVWKVVDATWDSHLSKILPVNTWDGESDTKIAVPALETFSDEKSRFIMDSENQSSIESDLKTNGEFYKKFNDWLESKRTYENF